MTRVYIKKGEKALSARIDIPVTMAVWQHLGEEADRRGMTRTQFARLILIEALGA